MKKRTSLFALILIIVLACGSQLNNIDITQDISMSIPNKYKFMVKDSANYLKTWKTSINDDQFAVYRFSIDQPDSLSIFSKRQAFKKNINDFLQAFDLKASDFKNLDSTFTYKANLFQCDLTFDFVDNNNKYGFNGRFLVSLNNFIAIFYQMPYPINKFSIGTKDKLFASIKTK